MLYIEFIQKVMGRVRRGRGSPSWLAQGGFFPPFCLVVSVVLRMHRQSGQLLGVPEDSVVAFCKLLNGAPKKADTTSCTESMLECMRYWRYADAFWRNMLNAFGSK